MTEEEARAHVRALVADADAFARLERLAALVMAENERQNLVARSTLSAIWHRHILDSVQLLPLAAGRDGGWVDIGTGGGFPGLAIAAATDRPMLLVEPRRQRARFLADAAAALALPHVTVEQRRVEQVTGRAAIVTARAVATPAAVVAASHHLAVPTTRWLLQRGIAWQDDLMGLRREWEGVFHVEHSMTSGDARIIVADQVSRR